MTLLFHVSESELIVFSPAACRQQTDPDATHFLFYEIFIYETTRPHEEISRGPH